MRNSKRQSFTQCPFTAKTDKPSNQISNGCLFKPNDCLLNVLSLFGGHIREVPELKACFKWNSRTLSQELLLLKDLVRRFLLDPLKKASNWQVKFWFFFFAFTDVSSSLRSFSCSTSLLFAWFSSLFELKKFKGFFLVDVSSKLAKKLLIFFF